MTRAFKYLLASQLVSTAGTAFVNFALLLLVVDDGRTAMPAVMMGLAHFAPFVLVSPIAGVVVDRVDRKLVLIGCDLFCLAIALGLYAMLRNASAGHSSIYVAMALSGAAQSFRSPAYIAVTSELLKKEHYSRSNGMRYLGDSIAYISAPVVVVALLEKIGFGGFVIMDLVSFVVSATAIALTVKTGRPQGQTSDSDSGLSKGIAFGFRYIARRPGLLTLSASFFLLNYLSIFSSVLPAYYIAMSGRAALAATQMATSIGAIAGGLLISRWKGVSEKHRTALLLGGSALCSLVGQFFVGLSSSMAAWVAESAIAAALFSVTTATNMTLWQSKTAPKIQGRVFSARRVIEESAGPLGMISSGLIADQILSPMFTQERPMALAWQRIAHDPTGMGLLLSVCGVMGAAVALLALALPAIRRLDDDLPDLEDAGTVARSAATC